MRAQQVAHDEAHDGGVERSAEGCREFRPGDPPHGVGEAMRGQKAQQRDPHLEHADGGHVAGQQSDDRARPVGHVAHHPGCREEDHG